MTDRRWDANHIKAAGVRICKKLLAKGGSEGSQNDPQRVKWGSQRANGTCLLNNPALSYLIVIINTIWT